MAPARQTAVVRKRETKSIEIGRDEEHRERLREIEKEKEKEKETWRERKKEA